MKKQRLHETRQFWDEAAAGFDNEPDHGLQAPIVRDAWTELLKVQIPSSPTSILDIGCGTGSISLVLAEMGHHVTGIDLSAKMIDRAKAKAKLAGFPITFQVMDAFDPQLPEQQFDMIICRHLLWVMPVPATALQRWSKLMIPGGRMIMIEGFWGTGGGLHARQVVEHLPSTFSSVKVENLSNLETLWGKKVDNERYMVTAVFSPHPI